MQKSYTADSITVLKGLEPVKQRPGMYTRTENPLHVIQEVIDNAADEAMAGFCRKIAVTLHADVQAEGVTLAERDSPLPRQCSQLKPPYMPNADAA